jgi:cysteine synthase A
MVGSSRAWVRQAIQTLHAEQQRSADTHLLHLPFPEFPDVDIYMKDETSHPTGSLKHRLARSLFLHAISSSDVVEGTHVVEASSGSTAIAEAHFAKLLGLAFTAVIPSATAPAKIEAIRKAGGNVHFAAADEDVCLVAAELADRPGAWFMDQFTFAERATDWRGNNNIAESIFAQMQSERHGVPSWMVVGAGTGGTSATIGRYIRYRPELEHTRLCVVDPEGSALFRSYGADACGTAGTNSDMIEGIGRKRVPSSFLPRVIDCMMSVPDAASIACMRWLERRFGRRFGLSTGSKFGGRPEDRVRGAGIAQERQHRHHGLRCRRPLCADGL